MLRQIAEVRRGGEGKAAGRAVHDKKPAFRGECD